MRMDAVNLDMSIGLGNIVEIAVLAAGALGGYVTLKAVTADLVKRVAEATRRMDKVEGDLRTRADLADDRFDNLRVHVAEQCVKKNDLRDVEDRIGKRLDVVEHNIRNMVTELLGAIRVGAVPTRPSRRPGGAV